MKGTSEIRAQGYNDPLLVQVMKAHGFAELPLYKHRPPSENAKRRRGQSATDRNRSPARRRRHQALRRPHRGKRGRHRAPHPDHGAKGPRPAA
jgi:hypothetical protein